LLSSSLNSMKLPILQIPSTASMRVFRGMGGIVAESEASCGAELEI